MYERFTDRARKVMQLANKRAHSLNHEYIGTEHILLGLLDEGSGVGANVLKNLGVQTFKIVNTTMAILTRGPSPSNVGRLPLTPLAKKVIEQSIVSARTLNHNHVGTEHILLGLSAVQDGVASQILASYGATQEKLVIEAVNLLGLPEPTKTGKQPEPAKTQRRGDDIKAVLDAIDNLAPVAEKSAVVVRDAGRVLKHIVEAWLIDWTGQPHTQPCNCETCSAWAGLDATFKGVA